MKLFIVVNEDTKARLSINDSRLTAALFNKEEYSYNEGSKFTMKLSYNGYANFSDENNDDKETDGDSALIIWQVNHGEAGSPYLKSAPNNQKIISWNGVASKEDIQIVTFLESGQCLEVSVPEICNQVDLFCLYYDGKNVQVSIMRKQES